MLCPNCKTENDDSANFCVNCRASLKDSAPAEPASTEAPKTETETAPAETPAEPAAPAATTPETPAAPAAPAVAPKASGGTPNFFAVMIAGVLKPITTFKENLPKFADIKNAAILSLIVVAIATILSTVTSVVGIVRTEECVENCSSYSIFSSSDSKDKKKKMETKWDWDKLEKYDWFKSVGTTFLTNMITILALSGAYFGISKLFKSTTANFGRMLTVVAVGTIPFTIVGFLAPMIGAISTVLSGALYLASVGYGLSIIFVGLNLESGLEGDKKVYLNILALVCMVIVYYIEVRFMYGELGGKMFEALLSGFGGGNALSSFTTSSSSSSYDLDDLFN